MNDDTISRQAAIDVLRVGKKVLSRVLDDTDDVVGCEREKYSWGLGLIEAYINDMKELPPAHPEQRWIPCSERLPENKSYVLTTIYIPGRQRHARSGWYEDDLFMNDNGDVWKCTDLEVVAWMPLPEPYGGEQDDKN